EIHFGVALYEAVEEKSGEALGLRVGAEAGVQIGRIGFDDKDERGGIGWGARAGREEEESREEEDRKRQNITTEGTKAPQRSQRREKKEETRKEKRETQDPGTQSVPGAPGNPRPTRKSGVWGTRGETQERRQEGLCHRRRREDRKESAGRGIGDFTKDGGAEGACGTGEIGGAVVEGCVGQEGEGEGFFGVFGDAEFGGRENFDGGKSGSELRHDERIVSATAGDDELADFCFGKHEAVERVDYGERTEEGDAAKKIIGMGAMFLGQTQEFLDVGGAVIFAARGFWRGLAEIGVV